MIPFHLFIIQPDCCKRQLQIHNMTGIRVIISETIAQFLTIPPEVQNLVCFAEHTGQRSRQGSQRNSPHKNQVELYRLSFINSFGGNYKKKKFKRRIAVRRQLTDQSQRQQQRYRNPLFPAVGGQRELAEQKQQRYLYHTPRRK